MRHILLFDCVLLLFLWITQSGKDIPQLIFTLLFVVWQGHKCISSRDTLCSRSYIDGLQFLPLLGQQQEPIL